MVSLDIDDKGLIGTECESLLTQIVNWQAFSIGSV